MEKTDSPLAHLARFLGLAESRVVDVHVELAAAERVAALPVGDEVGLTRLPWQINTGWGGVGRTAQQLGDAVRRQSVRSSPFFSLLFHGFCRVRAISSAHR